MCSSTTEVSPELDCSTGLSLDEIQGCQHAAFEWAESYDSKDWERLRRCIAPTLCVDYRSVFNKQWEEMLASDYVDMVRLSGLGLSSYTP